MHFVAAAGSTGSFTLSWSVRDDGGTANGGVDRRSDALQVSVNTSAPAPAPAPAPVVDPAPSPVAGTPAPQPAAAVGAPAPVAAGPQEPRARATLAGDALVANGVTAVETALTDFAVSLQRHVFDEAFSLRTGSSLMERRELHLAGFTPASVDFELTGFTGIDRVGTRLSVEDLKQTLRSGAFLGQLDQLRNQLRQEFDLERTVSISVAGLSLGVSVVYILWLVRGGVLLGSYLSALPAWRLLDPLPVLAKVGDEEDDEEEALPAGAASAPDPLRGFS
jgi:hypothetical protein